MRSGNSSDWFEPAYFEPEASERELDLEDELNDKSELLDEAVSLLDQLYIKLERQLYGLPDAELFELERGALAEEYNQIKQFLNKAAN